MKLNTGLDAQVIPFDEPRPPEFSDEALALRFAECHAGNLRYVAVRGKWLAWDGMRWRSDNTLHAFDWARFICREAASRANDPRVQMAVARAETVAAVERLARADRRIAATSEQWDADPWLLNTPDGIIDWKDAQRAPRGLLHEDHRCRSRR
jgi:putative DNA primase/helicase